MRTIVVEILSVLMAAAALTLFVVTVGFLGDGDVIAAFLCIVMAFGALRASTDLARVVGFVWRGEP